MSKTKDMETKRIMQNELCALEVLKETTQDRVLKNAVTRALGGTPLFEVGDEVWLNCDCEFNGNATIVRRTVTKDGVRYAVCLYGCTDEIEGYSGDDMELNDRTSFHNLMELRKNKS